MCIRIGCIYGIVQWENCLFISANGHLEQEVKEDYWATTFYVLDDSWVAFCSGYTTNKAYLKRQFIPQSVVCQY